MSTKMRWRIILKVILRRDKSGDSKALTAVTTPAKSVRVPYPLSFNACLHSDTR